MPQIIVAADRGAAFGQGAVTLREGVSVADFESEHFASQLVERLGWAVDDADQLERSPGEAEPTAEEPELVQETKPVRREPHADREPHTDREPHADHAHRAHTRRAGDREPVTAR